jgi:zinc transporter 5/7
MFLHILADALGSVGVIISSLAIQLFGWQWADPVCSIFIAGLIFVSIWPLFQRSGAALLQRTPYSLDGKLSILRQKVGQRYYKLFLHIL